VTVEIDPSIPEEDPSAPPKDPFISIPPVIGSPTG
jgi:hypothetical protein